MTNVQIRNVPDDVHKELSRRAAQAGQSLQQYLAAQLATIASTPTLEDVIARIESREKGTLTVDDALTSLREDRARR